ncbi:hypothetical protein [Streptomyces sp. DHE17-7]|uniref:hypothetical protein n=1 Tax=Streptomyces sp. DHE17-7 TaxID=2759949 RepID=UPI0022EAD439|nr:hypothetical protein [Streptomyces sp. DHE17-7]MBJ6623411.1 hypothetical protein [Streptomyces sp. DHE17-7]
MRGNERAAGSQQSLASAAALLHTPRWIFVVPPLFFAACSPLVIEPRKLSCTGRPPPPSFPLNHRTNHTLHSLKGAAMNPLTGKTRSSPGQAPASAWRDLCAAFATLRGSGSFCGTPTAAFLMNCSWH